MALALNLVSTITPEGYAAATENVPNANGFRIEITKIQPVVNGVPKGFFPATGTALGGGQVRVRATIASDAEEYNFNELWIYDGISNAIFCKIKRADGGNLDFVSPYKKSVLNYNIKFTTLPSNTVTIIADGGQSLALAELDAHVIAADPHPQYLFRNTQLITDWNVALTNGKYMGAGAANAPHMTDWYIGDVTAHNDSWVTQIVYAFSNDNATDSIKFKRDKNAGTWTEWVQLLETKDELDSRFVKISGQKMTGVLGAKSGTGINAGIKGSTDVDTGIEWLTDGVLQTVINGVVRQKSDGATTQFARDAGRFELQANGNIVSYDASNNPIWHAFNTVTQEQRASDNVYNDATFVNITGDTMSGVLRANAGTGLNAGIKGSTDVDTGIEWLTDGVLQTVINGVVRQKSDGATTQFARDAGRFELQANGNIVSYDASNNPIWDAFNTVTQEQRVSDNVYNDATFVNITGDTMSGVLRANAGTGLNAGIKGSTDVDTGIEWLTDGVLQTVINGVVRQKSDGATTQFARDAGRFELQANGNIVSYDASNNPIWDAFNTVTQEQRVSDNVYNDATFVNITGDTMSGVLRANAGTGLNAGIKGSTDVDTGIEWLTDGVLQTVINGVVRQKSDGATTQFARDAGRFELQANGNIVSYDASNNPIWHAFNTYQKSDYGGSVGAGWYRTPHPSTATGIIKQWGITTVLGQDATVTVNFPVAFPNVCNFVVLTENGLMDGSGSGSLSVDSVTNSSFTIRKGTDQQHSVRWVAEGY